MTKKTLSLTLVSLGLLVLTGCMAQREPVPAPSAEHDDGSQQQDPPPAPSAGFVRVENYSSTTIWYLYISPSASSDWGPDQLGSHVLASSAAASYSVAACDQSYDLMVQGEGHRTLLRRFGVFVPCGSGFTWRIIDG